MNKQEKIYLIYSVVVNTVFYAFLGMEFYAVHKNIFNLCWVDIFLNNFFWFYLSVFISPLWGGWLWFKEKSKSRLVKLMFFVSLFVVIVGSLLLFIQIYGRRVEPFVPSPISEKTLQEKCGFIKNNTIVNW